MRLSNRPLRRVAIVSGPRNPQPTGLELAEIRLYEALQAVPRRVDIELRVVGGRHAQRHAKAVAARWIPARPGSSPARLWRGASLVHLIGLDVPAPTNPDYVVTVRDLAALRFDDEGTLTAAAQSTIKDATRVICVSAFTAREVHELLDVPFERITIIPDGPGQLSLGDAPGLTPDDHDRLGIEGDYVLRMGGYTKRKNLGVLLDAWPRIRAATGASLVLAGPPQPARDRELARSGPPEGVVVLDYVDAALAARLLRSATALVSTSVYEGFGLPPLEAMTAGVPVVGVHSQSIEEVCDGAAVLVDNDPAMLSEAIALVISDSSRRAELAEAGRRRAARFTWERSADRLVQMYEELL